MAIEVKIGSTDITSKIGNVFRGMSVDLLADNVVEYSGIHLEIEKTGVTPSLDDYAYMKDGDDVIWSGYVRSLVERLRRYDMDIVPEMHYINRFAATNWRGDTIREKLSDVLNDYLEEETFESETTGAVPSNWTATGGGGAGWEVSITRAHRGSRSIYPDWASHDPNESTMYLPFAAQSSGKLYAEFMIWVPTAGDIERCAEVVIAYGTTALVGFSISDEDAVYKTVNGTTWTLTGGGITRNTWNKVVIMCDLDNDEWSMWVNRSLMVDAESKTFSSDPDRFYVHHERGQGANVEPYIDEVFIYIAEATVPYTEVIGLDSDADTILDAVIQGLYNLTYPGKYQGDIVYDCAMLAQGEAGVDVAFIFSHNQKLYLKGEFSSVDHTLSDSEIAEFDEASEYEDIAVGRTTADINSNLQGNLLSIFTVSGVTITPTVGARYTDGTRSFDVVSTSIAAGSGTVTTRKVIGSGDPDAAPDTLSKTHGTGDASLSYSAVGSGDPITDSYVDIHARKYYHKLLSTHNAFLGDVITYTGVVATMIVISKEKVGQLYEYQLLKLSFFLP